jgi:alkanesulfonate monooxygenase SsuD/methylene tetrahydromethanopterin reductase-like flavin-dependent oxidoreductase (luciferase family)
VSDARARRILVAKVPRKKLRLPSEVRWLEEQVAGHGRGFPIAGAFFVTTIKAETEEEAEALAAAFQRAIVARYAEDSCARWAPVDEDLRLSPGDLHPIAQGLMHMAAKG